MFLGVDKLKITLTKLLKKNSEITILLRQTRITTELNSDMKSIIVTTVAERSSVKHCAKCFTSTNSFNSHSNV